MAAKKAKKACKHKCCRARGKRNGRWKGGTAVNTNGYLRITAGPLKGAYVHQVVAEAKIGRALESDEEVHHLDGDGLNPHPDNLEVIPKELHPARDQERRDEEAPF